MSTTKSGFFQSCSAAMKTIPFRCGAPTISTWTCAVIFIWIVFSNRVDGNDQLWLMDRDGNNARVLFKSDRKFAVAPTWSPHGDQVLVAVGKDSADLAKQLFIINLDGGEPRLLDDQILTPGRTDWSRQDLIAYFMGEA